MPKNADKFEQVYAKDRQEWRAWLEQNHATSPGVWLIYYKKDSGKPRLDHAEGVEEALCFGWIDSVANKLDDERYLQFFSPRKPKSGWSKLNKQRVEKLTAQGLIAPAGLAAIETAKHSGAWSALDAISELIIPDDLQATLDANETAKSYFAAFPPSIKKVILQWIQAAKRPETRAKRVAETVRLAADNKRVNQVRE